MSQSWSFLGFPSPCLNHLSLKPWTLKGIDRATHPPAPTSNEEKLTSLRWGPWHHHPSMAPHPPWARASKGLFTHSVLRVVKQPRILGIHRLLGLILPYGASPILPKIRGPLALPIPNHNSLRHPSSFIHNIWHSWPLQLKQFGTHRRTYTCFYFIINIQSQFQHHHNKSLPFSLLSQSQIYHYLLPKFNLTFLYIHFQYT